MRRQSRSFATAQEDPEESSIGDESDSTSTAGSSSATSAFARSIFDNDDMPGALADRLRLFRSFSEDHPSLGYKNTNNDEPFPTNEKNRRALNEGTVIRLTSSMVEARCSPDSLASAAGLLKALRTKSVRF